MKRSPFLALLAVLVTVFLTTSCREQSKEDNMVEASKLATQGNAKGAALIYKILLENYPDDVQARVELAKAYLDMGKPDQAEKEARRLASLPQPPDDLQLLLGKTLLAQSKIADARKEFSAYLVKIPNSAEGWEFLGHALIRERTLPQAADAYRHALSLDPGRTLARTGLIETLLIQNESGQAREQVDILLAQDPNNHAGLYLLARIQAGNGEVAAAIATYDAIAAKNPQDARAPYSSAALKLATQGVSDDIANTAATLVKNFPNQYEGYKLQGLVSLARGEGRKALSDLQQALRLRPEVETHYFLAKAYASMGNLETAISELQQVLTLRPDHMQTRQLLANLQLRLNRPDEAVTELEKLLQHHPDDSAGKLLLGDIYLSMNNPDKSLELFSEIPAGSAHAARANFMKGLTLATTGKLKEAETALLEAVVQDPASLDYRTALVALYRQQQRLDDALGLLDKTGLSAADSAQACLIQANIRVQQGKIDDSIALLEKAKTLAPDQIAPYRSLADIYFQMLQPDKALDQYRQAIAKLPQSPAAHGLYATGLERVSRNDEAREEYEQALQSKQPEAYINLAAFLARMNQKTEALNILEQCPQESANNLSLLVSLARLQTAIGNEAKSLETIKRIDALNPVIGTSERLRLELSQKRWDQAEIYAAKFIEFNPSTADNYMPLASVKMQRGDLPGAEAVVRKALEMNNSSTSAELILASIQLKMGRSHDAFGLYDGIIARGKNLAEAYAARGMAWQTTGNLEAAAKDYVAALRLQSRMPMVLNNLAMIYTNDPKRAAQGLTFALAANALAANNPLVLDTVGYALWKNGQKQDAAVYFSRAAALDPQNAEIAKHVSMSSAKE